MKKILITGANSYIGMSFEKYIRDNYLEDYIVDTVDMIDGSWREKSFAGYDSVFHVAGIAHQRETEENAPIYYMVNRDLAIETAKKAKSDGVKQFVFLSSMSVYGMDSGIVTKDTIPNPKSNYGRSKLQAEDGINSLDDEFFKTCTIRPPMVYGKGCKGNFQTIVKIVKKLHFFPKIKNERSLIYIDNLCSFVKLCVDRELCGLYFPQNEEYVKTVDIAKNISIEIEKKIYFSVLLGLCVFLIRPFVSVAKKAFGSLKYVDTEEFEFSYCVADNDDSIKRSV